MNVFQNLKKGTGKGEMGLDTCLCMGGMGGADCASEVQCNGNGGILEIPGSGGQGVCVCNPGYAGAVCHIQVACGDCGEPHGQCVNGRCQCVDGYMTDNAASRLCTFFWFF